MRGLVENGWWGLAVVVALEAWSGLCWGSEGLGNGRWGQMGTS